VPIVTYRDTAVPTDGHGGDTRNALRYIIDAHSDEPLFVIRGRDLLAVPVIAQYSAIAEEHMLYGMVDQANHHRQRFGQWRDNHPQLLKLPNPYPGWER